MFILSLFYHYFLIKSLFYPHFILVSSSNLHFICILSSFPHQILIKSSFYRLYMYKYAVNIMSVPEIIERSQEDKSTAKYRTFVLLPVL